MSKERQLFERAITEAYEREAKTTGSPSEHEARNRVVRLGRRRRLVRSLGSLGLAAAVGIGAVVSVNALSSEQDRRRVADAPVIGAERIMEFGGPLAASDDALFVANGRLSNDAGGMASVARYDLATGKVTNTDPSSVASPLNVALGGGGMWLVQWTGDMPVGGEGHPVQGRVQLIDPVSGQLLIDLPREDSAPYDVAVGELDGRETAWVVDAGRDELLQVDAASGDIETIELQARPYSVTVGAGAVWVSGNTKDKEGLLTRYDLADGSLETMSVGHCMNDVVVVGSSLWASDYCNGEVHRFDPVTASAHPRLVMPSVVRGASVSVGGNPNALATADGLLWVATGSEIVRVDPDRDEVVGAPTVIGDGVQYLVASGDTVFASSFSGVFRLGEGLPVREPVQTPTPEEEEKPSAEETCDLENVMCIPLDREGSVAGAGFGSAWVGNVGEGKTFGIARFDAVTGEEIARLHTEGFVQGFASDDRSMWTLLDAGGQLTLLMIDPETTKISASYDIGGAGDIGTASIAAGGGYVWVSQPAGSVTRVSAADGELARTSYGDDLPGYGIDNGPVYLAYGEGRLWLSYGTGHLGVVDPASGELVRVEEDALGVNAYDIIYAAGQLWAPHQTGHGKNVMTYVSTEGDQTYKGTVSLLDAPPGSAATDGTRIWVLQQGFEDRPGWLVEVDPATHSVVGEPIEVDLGFQGDVAMGDGYVWVTGNSVLYRVAPTG